MSTDKIKVNQQYKKPTFMKLFADSLCDIFANEKNSVINLNEICSLIDLNYLKNFNESKGYFTLKRAMNFDELNLISKKELKNLLSLKDLSLLNMNELNFVDTRMLVNGMKSLLLFFLALIVVGGTSLNFVVFNQLIDNAVVKGEELSVAEMHYVENNKLDLSNFEQKYFDELLNKLDSQVQCNTELVGANIDGSQEYTYINGFKIISVCTVTE